MGPYDGSRAELAPGPGAGEMDYDDDDDDDDVDMMDAPIEE
jgi:hypothetical protein